jgi:LPS export ABC transporter permease LptG
MLRTLDRYVIREILPPFFLSLVVFTFLLEIPPVMRDLEYLVAKGVSWQVAARILLTLIPQGLGITIPMALLTGTLIGLGRLSSDREGVALLACGVSPYRLLRPVLLLGALGTVATAYVMFKAIPDANQTFREITFEVISKRLETDIRPRVFFEDFPGWVLYSRDEPETGGGWKEVLVANTSKAEETQLFMAERGRLVLDREQRRVELVLSQGVRYSARPNGAVDVYRFEKPGQEVLVELDPETVFRRQDIGKGITEKSVAELQADARAKIGLKQSPHPEIMWIQQKYSIPLACIVFSVIGLALGLTVARDSKMAGFVLGIAVIFAYYIVMYTAEAHTKGYYKAFEDAGTLDQASYTIAQMARWWPNIILGLFGIVALVWRARFAERKLPVSLPIGLPQLPSRWTRTAPASAGSTDAAATLAPHGRQRTVVVIRLPRLRVPGGPGILDRYVARLYVRVIALAFAALLGLFYIATFIDKSEKIFKGQTSGGTVLMFLAYMTPQYVYYVIPMAALLAVLVTFGLLSRTSELTVMKACGVSLYRIAVPVLVLSLVGSAALFALEQEILARANQKAEALDDIIRGRPPKTLDPLLRRWVIGRDGAIYHYTFFDPARTQFNALSVYRPAGRDWRLASHTFVAQAVHENDAWIGVNGWRHEIAGTAVKSAKIVREPLALEPPDYFATEQPVTEMMTVPELRRYVAELAESGFNIVPLSVELQRKMAFPFVTIVMTLLAVPFGVTTGRRGTLYGIGMGITIALLYWVISSVFLAVGRAGLLSPMLAAWTPNVIVLGVAGYLMLTAKT